MPEESKPEFNKIDFLGLWKMIFAGKKGMDAKVVVKDMLDPDSHTTIQFRNDASIDVHEINEKTNQYKSLMRKWFDPNEAVKFMQVLMKMTKILEPIDATSEPYRHLSVLPFAL